MKRSALGRGGAGARAFVDRGRVSSATSLRSRLPSPEIRLPNLDNRESEPLTMREALAVPFRAREPARSRRCQRCGAPAVHHHHWLAKQHLRVYARGEAQRRSLEPEAVRAMLRNLLRCRANLCPLCVSCHSSLTDWMCGAGGRDGWRVPDAAVAFAGELGPEWRERLVRLYPGAS